MKVFKPSLKPVSVVRKLESEKPRKINWLRFLNTYRTMCRAPDPNFRRVLEDIRELALAA
jgi:hypothetical protein